MSVENEILRIQHNIANTYAAVSDKGGEVPLQPTSANLAAAVESIPQGPTYTAGDGIDITDTETGAEISVTLPTKSLTKAEYDALTEAEKQAETVYLVEEPAWEPVPLSIQEYDTENGWHVRKWSDGYVEMVYVFDYVSVAWNATTGGYYINKLDGIPLPIQLVKKYMDDAKLLAIETTAAYSIHRWRFEEENTTLGMYIFCTVNPGVGKTFTISVSVTGRWK